MNKVVRKRRGGPRTFDRDEAVATAMRLFWRHGYEGVSLADLTAAIGIAPPSLYAAFGSKAGLYREALERYSDTTAALTALHGAKNLEDAVATILRQGADAVTDPDRERGCMLSSGMLQCGPDHVDLAAGLAERRAQMRQAIAEALGPWLEPERAASLARYVTVLLQGLSVQAIDGATRAELEEVIEEAVANIGRRTSLAAG